MKFIDNIKVKLTKECLDEKRVKSAGDLVEKLYTKEIDAIGVRLVKVVETQQGLPTDEFVCAVRSCFGDVTGASMIEPKEISSEVCSWLTCAIQCAVDWKDEELENGMLWINFEVSVEFQKCFDTIKFVIEDPGEDGMCSETLTICELN